MRDCEVSLHLHDGFDWSSTQKAIELEVKSVRRRLEKIRQLLASGQTPDESVEQTGTMLFNSVYVGLPQYAADGDADAYLAALGDDDLLHLDFADDTSQSSSFQSVKGRPSGGSPQLPSRLRAKRKQLTRSKHARIVVELTQVRLAVEVFAPTSATASSVRLTVDEVEILDQIKTSTWKKFLTELRVDGRGNTREADSHMITLELLTVRPADDVSREECRLRVSLRPRAAEAKDLTSGAFYRPKSSRCVCMSTRTRSTSSSASSPSATQEQQRHLRPETRAPTAERSTFVRTRRSHDSAIP